MSDAFYKAFEDKYRGSRSFIKSQLQIYLPYIELLKTVYPHGATIDLACARGEWLEMLNEAGFDASGVDTDRSLVELCKQRGLNVRQVDPLEALKSLEDSSQVIVSGFELAECVPFEQLQAITQEAFRVLKPGGVLILETSNPENILVGSHSFYNHPRHIKPLPPQLLAFLPEYYGFSTIQLLRLHARSKAIKTQALSLHDVLDGVSPTVAVIAQKENLLASQAYNINAIESAQGVKQESLTARYDQQLAQHFERLNTTATQALVLAQEAENYRHGALTWRLTRLVRWFDHQIFLLDEHGVSGRIKAFFVRVMTSLVNRAFNFAVKRPKVNALGTSVIIKTGLYHWLCKYLVPVEAVVFPPTLEEEEQAHHTNFRLVYLDKEAMEIYAELERAVHKNKGSQL